MQTTISMENDPQPEDIQIARAGLSHYNRQHGADDAFTPLTLFLRDEAGQIVGGLLGGTYWGWLYVEILWIDELRRGQGYGAQLLVTAEQEAVRRGCKNAFLDTMDFQALDFYRKQGYTLWGTLEGIPAGHNRYYLRKTLVSPELENNKP